MRLPALAMMAVLAVAATGCVSASTYKESVGKIDALKRDNAKLTEELQATQAAKDKVQQTLDTAHQNLDEAGRTQHNLEVKLAEVKGELDLLKRAHEEMRNERDMLQSKTDDLDNRSRDLATELETQQSLVAQLQADKQRLLSGATTAQEEIARIQQRAGELEVTAARVPDLEGRLSDRDAQIANMRARVGQLETEAARVPDLEQRLSQRDEEIGQLRQATTDQERRMTALLQERDQLSDQLKRQTEILESEAEEKARLEQERAAKEAEIARLTRTHDDLKKSLEEEISKGNIRIQQVRDRLTINMVDKVLFDSGQAHVKPAGLKVLNDVGAILTNVHDKQIRVEGHTDNVPIGARLQERFPTNWELSSARATSVVRYLLDKNLVDPSNVSAIGYADTRPVSDNDSEDGRKANRRIEIVLYPKDLSQIASQVKR